MQTLARKRAEELFAEFTHEVDLAEKTPMSPEDRPTGHTVGPKTIHLPSDTKAELAGWRTTRRSATKSRSGRQS